MELAWLYVAMAVVSEIIWAIALKKAEGFTRFWPSFIAIGTGLFTLYCLSMATTSLPIAMVYPIWTGLGAVGVTIYALVFYQESLNIIQLFLILLILVGVILIDFYHVY